MSTLQVVLGSVSAIGRGGLNAPVAAMDSGVFGKQAITTTGVSQVSTVVAPSDVGNGPDRELFWCLSLKGAAVGAGVWVNFGAGTPVAASGATWLLLDGANFYLFKARPGETLAVIDAA